jgi:hypothetical protein
MDPIDVAELALSLTDVDPELPSPARIYDFWLGGSQNFESDREVGRRAAAAMPTLTAGIRANRAFLGRAVRHLVTGYGITQFLDLGSGVPTVGNVHEVAREFNPSARVVYVDIDQVAVAHARHLLAGVDGVVPILADLRRPADVLEHPLVTSTLDLKRPIAILMNAVLHFIPDSDDPAGIVRSYTDAAAPGSYLVLSHAAPDRTYLGAQTESAKEYQDSTRVPFTLRDEAEISGWLLGLEMEEPGLVELDKWRPDPGDERQKILRGLGVLALKRIL